MLQMQVAKTRLGPDETPGAQLGPSPRILVLRESGDVEVDLELGDRENTPDGSFARTTTRRMSNSSASEEEQEQEEAGKVATAWNGKSRGVFRNAEMCTKCSMLFAVVTLSKKKCGKEKQAEQGATHKMSSISLHNQEVQV